MYSKKKALLLKMWAWISLTINTFICALIAFMSTTEYNFIIIGGVVAFAIMAQAFLKLSRDKRLDDLSISSVIILYVSAFSISCVLLYCIYAYVSTIGLGLMASAVIAEGLIAMLIWRKKSR